MKARSTALTFNAIAILTIIARPDAAAASLVGLWQFENNFNDTSLEANNGSQLGGVTFTASQTGYGQAASFSGTNTHVVVPDDASLDMTSVMTAAAWVFANGVGFEGILAKNPSAGSSSSHAGNYELRLEGGSQPVNFLYQRGGVNDTAAYNGGAPTNVAAGAWHHVAVTVDGTGPLEVIRIYVDGVLKATNLAGTNGFGATNNNPLYIGNRADLFTDFNGKLDDVALFNHILDASDVRLLMRGDKATFIL